MRAQTAPQKEGLSPFECIYGRPFLCTNIVIDIEALELTSCVTQLSLFQQALTELPERTPDLASESSKPLFEPGTEGLIKTLGPRGPSLEPHWEGPCQVILSSPTAVNMPGIDSWVHHTRVKRWQNQVTSFYVFTFYALTLHFSDGPDNLYEPIYVYSKNPESLVSSSRQCLTVLGSLLCSILQSV